MRAPETPGDSQRVCNEVVEKNWTRVASVGRGIRRDFPCQTRIDRTVSRTSWERKEVVDTASASGHCLDCEGVSEL